MKSIGTPMLISATIALFTGLTASDISRAAPPIEANIATHHSTAAMETLDISPLRDHQLIAQSFYPPASGDQAVMVLGQGRATAPADTAEIELFFADYDLYVVPEEGLVLFNDNGSEPPGQVLADSEIAPLTEEMLQPVVEAIAATGVSTDAIEVNIRPGNSYAYPYSPGINSVVVTLDDPSREQVQEIVTAATDAVSGSEEVVFESVNLQYAIDNCEALESEAYVAAIGDAQNRASALAIAMQVELADIPSVAESPFSLLYPSCNSSSNFAFPFPFGAGTPLYDPDAPAEVQVWRDIFVTYPIR